MAVATGVRNLYLPTATGLITCATSEDGQHAEAVADGMTGEMLRGVAPDPFNPEHLYACSVTDVFSSDDGGQTWTWLPSGGLNYREIWALAVHPTRPNEIYVGTLPAAVYVSENGGKWFRELASFREVPDYPRWTFPAPPHAAHVREIALTARAPDDILVGVEEGGVILSHDRGSTWEDISGPPSDGVYPGSIDSDFRTRPEPVVPVQGRVFRDVHVVARDPDSLDRFYATTGYGFYLTDNAGRSWTRPRYGLGNGYAVPLAIHPDAPSRLFLGAAENGPPFWPGERAARPGPFAGPRAFANLAGQKGGALSAVLRSDDGGETWRRLEGGLPAANSPMASGIAVDPLDANMVFVTYTDGTVYASADAGETWRLLIQVRDRLYGVRVHRC